MIWGSFCSIPYPSKCLWVQFMHILVGNHKWSTLYFWVQHIWITEANHSMLVHEQRFYIEIKEVLRMSERGSIIGKINKCSNIWMLQVLSSRLKYTILQLWKWKHTRGFGQHFHFYHMIVMQWAGLVFCERISCTMATDRQYWSQHTIWCSAQRGLFSTPCIPIKRTLLAFHNEPLY